MARPKPAAIVVWPSLVAGALIAAACAVAGFPALVGAGAAIASAAAVAAWLWRGAPRSMLTALGAKPVPPGSQRRLENVVEGVCTTHGMAEPSLHIVETPAVNAASVGLGRKSAHLVMTSGALAELDRLELEAVVTRQLCELRRGLDAATVLGSVARLPGARPVTTRLAARVINHRTVTYGDLEAVRLTSYPPALAEALRKSMASPLVDTSPAVEHLWLVAPDAGAAAGRQPLPSLRIAALGLL